MKMQLVYFLLILLITKGLGCHSTDNTKLENVSLLDYGGEIRRKRQVSNEWSYVSLEDFFVKCMYPYLWRSRLDVRTVVRFTISETLWYHNTDRTFCARHQDTASCWSRTLFRYLNPKSWLMNIAMSCIYRFERSSRRYTANPQILATPRHSSYYGRHWHTNRGLAINEAEVESRLRQVLSPSSIPSVRSLIILVKEEAICSPATCDCTGVMIPPNEKCGQFWYTRIASLTRLNRKTRKRISSTMNAVIHSKIREDRDSRRRRNRYRNFVLNYILAMRLLATKSPIPAADIVTAIPEVKFITSALPSILKPVVATTMLQPLTTTTPTFATAATTSPEVKLITNTLPPIFMPVSATTTLQPLTTTTPTFATTASTTPEETFLEQTLSTTFMPVASATSLETSTTTTTTIATTSDTDGDANGSNGNGNRRPGNGNRRPSDSGSNSSDSDSSDDDDGR